MIEFVKGDVTMKVNALDLATLMNEDALDALAYVFLDIEKGIVDPDNLSVKDFLKTIDRIKEDN